MDQKQQTSSPGTRFAAVQNQIDTYALGKVYQGNGASEAHVGWVWVGRDPDPQYTNDPSRTIEHWLLFGSSRDGVKAFSPVGSQGEGFRVEIVTQKKWDVPDSDPDVFSKRVKEFRIYAQEVSGDLYIEAKCYGQKVP